MWPPGECHLPRLRNAWWTLDAAVAAAIVIATDAAAEGGAAPAAVERVYSVDAAADVPTERQPSNGGVPSHTSLVPLLLLLAPIS